MATGVPCLGGFEVSPKEMTIPRVASGGKRETPLGGRTPDRSKLV